MTSARIVRTGSAAKRAAILLAARELFVHDGFERTSMDAVAARANVSKRTVYDYFGGKAGLLLDVSTGAMESLLASLKGAVNGHLSDDLPIRTAEDLERALVAFVVEISTTLVTSDDYATAFTLGAALRAEIPDRENPSLSTAPEAAIAERLAHFDDTGLLDVPDPLLAADHFNALTMLLAYSNQSNPARADADQVRSSMTAGVHAFMRAYARRP